MTKREAVVDVKAKDKTKSATTSAKKNLTSLEKSFKSLKSVALKMGATLGVALSARALKQYTTESVKLYGVQVQAEQKLGAAIRATGGDVDNLLPQYKSLASSIQGVTTVGDEASLALIQQAKSMGIADDRIGEATKGAIGLSKALGMGTQQAIRGVTNAMNGEFTTLQRYIPELRTAATESEKMAIVQKRMAEGFEIAKAEADNGYGAMVQLKNSFGDFNETTGELIAEGLKPMTKWLQGVIEKANETRVAMIDVNELLDGMINVDAAAVDALGIIEINQRLDQARSRLEKLQKQSSTGAQMQVIGVENLIKALEKEKVIKAQLARSTARQSAIEQQRAEEDARNAEMNRVAAAMRLAINDEFAQKEFDLNATTFQRIEAERQKMLDKMRDAYVLTGSEVQRVNDYYNEMQVQHKEELIGKMTTISEEWRQGELSRIQQQAEAEREAAEERIRLAREEMQQKIQYAMQYAAVFQGIASSFANIQSNMYQKRIDAAEEGSAAEKRLMREQAAAQKRWSIFQAVINTATAVTKTMTSVPYPWNIPLAGLQSAAGLAQVADIKSQPLPAFAAGGDFMARSPQTIVVGENGPERVRIDPQPDTRGATGININVYGNFYGAGGVEEFARFVVKSIKQGQRAGRVETL